MSVSWIILLTMLLSFGSGSRAALPAESVNYPIPQVFEKQREIIYGEDHADIYFSLKPQHTVEQVFIKLTSSHPTKLLLFSEGKLVAETDQQIFVLKDSISKIKVTARKVGQFSLASVNLTVHYLFPKSSVIRMLEVDQNDIYGIKDSRDSLLQRIDSLPEFWSEDLGAFLYNNRFLKPALK